ncbi:MAG: hypothetical protein IPM29_24440 [Planctomycetes bacterium]|nr:hypothetical protein [Planctomycetota bacterium]
MHHPIAVLLLAPLGLAQSPPSYAVHFLGNGSAVAAVNELGVAVGSLSQGGVQIAAISLGGQPQQRLPLPAGFTSSLALDVNDHGVVVGVVSPVSTPSLQPHAAAWWPGPAGYTVQVLGEPAGMQYSAATGINNLGDIVGSAGTTPWFYWVQGVHFAATGPVALPGVDSAEDVNDRRKVLTRNQLFDLATGQLETVPLPPGNWNGFVPYALNELDGFAGKLIGFSSTCGAFPMRYRRSDGWTYVGGCGTNTGANAINNLGDTLTWAGTWAAGVNFDGIGYFGFGALIDPSQGNWTTGAGADINDARQLVVGIRDASGTLNGAALLSPMGVQCQRDLGHAGPGTLRLAVCGDLLTLPGSRATLTVAGATPNAIVWIAIGRAASPMPLLGGTLVPGDLAAVVGVPTDGRGNFSFPITGGVSAPRFFWLQAVEPSGTGLWFSNAVAIGIGS